MGITPGLKGSEFQLLSFSTVNAFTLIVWCLFILVRINVLNLWRAAPFIMARVGLIDREKKIDASLKSKYCNYSKHVMYSKILYKMIAQIAPVCI